MTILNLTFYILASKGIFKLLFHEGLLVQIWTTHFYVCQMSTNEQKMLIVCFFFNIKNGSSGNIIQEVHSSFKPIWIFCSFFFFFFSNSYFVYSLLLCNIIFSIDYFISIIIKIIFFICFLRVNYFNYVKEILQL